MKIQMFGVALLLILTGRAWAETPAAPLTPGSYRLEQCVIVQPGSRPVVYYTRPDGQVEAIEVSNGKVLWHTGKASFPLLARGRRLLALLPASAGKIGYDLAILDPRSGQVRKRLPAPGEPIPGCPGDGLSGTFRLEAVTQDGRDCLVWTKTWHPTPGGAYRGPDYVYPPGSSGSKQGLYVVDLENEQILPPAGTYPSLSLRGQTNPWGGYSIEPFEVDGITSQVAMEMVNNHPHLLLRRWKDAEALPEVSLGEPPWNSCGVVVCADHRYVLGVWQVPEKHDPFLYHVGVFSSSTGEKKAEVDAASWPSTAQVFGNVLVAYFPSRVFGIDLSTGKEIWTKTVKDLTYRGPYPPSAAPRSQKP
jgi:hypothetical protein